MLDNEYVRIAAVCVAAGATLALPAPPPQLVVAIGSNRPRAITPDGGVSLVDRRSGEVGWTARGEHSAEVVIGPVHAVEIAAQAATA